MNAITSSSHQPWSKENWSGRKSRSDCKISGPFGLRLQIAEETCDLALFDLAIDRKLRACVLTKLCERDIAHGEHVSSRAIVMQQKTQRCVQFEITDSVQRRSRYDRRDSTQSSPSQKAAMGHWS